jgi:hypothetical protein
VSTRIWEFRDEAVRTIDLTGFEVEAGGEAVGRVHSATNEIDVSYVVVDAALRRVVLPAGLITDVDAKRQKVVLSCTAAEVRGAPKYDEQEGLAPAYRSELGDYYTTAPETSEEPDEPRRDDLYAEANRLGVRGRSTMTKDELVEEIDRLQTDKATPIQVQAFLDGVIYPVDRDDLLEQAEKHHAGADVRATLERLPDRRFEDPTDVSRAIGELP